MCVRPNMPQSTVLSPHDEHNFPNTHIVGWCKRLGSHFAFSCAARALLLLRGTFCSCLRSLGGSSFFFSPFPCHHCHRHCFRYCHRDHPYHCIIISIRMEHHQHQHDRHQHHCHSFNCIPSLFPSWRMYLIFSRNDRAIK